MMSAPDLAWLAERTNWAPAVLRGRAESFARKAEAEDLVSQLAKAGEQALDAAMAAGENRVAALDLLAADALITLALLAHAERDPATLAATARALRDQASI
jgi:hypothetical protein